MSIVWDTVGGGFGDLWCTVNFLLQKSQAAKDVIYLSRWDSFERRTDHKATLEAMIDMIDAPGARVQVVDEVANMRVGGEPFALRYLPTKIQWSRAGRQSRDICIQWAGVSSARMKNPSLGEQAKLIVWAKRTGHTLLPIGLPLTMQESARALSRCRAFVGPCSGMSHLCHSVGAPCFLLEYLMKVAWWHGKNHFTVCEGVDVFERKFHAKYHLP
jgi:hypothetical protein